MCSLIGIEGEKVCACSATGQAKVAENSNALDHALAIGSVIFGKAGYEPGREGCCGGKKKWQEKNTSISGFASKGESLL